MWKNVICAVGADQGEGIRELIGPGTMVYVVPATEVAAGTELAPGRKVVVNAAPGTLRGETALCATQVRRFGPTTEDERAYERVDRALCELGLDALAVHSVGEHLEASYARALHQGARTTPDPVDDLLDRLARGDRRFPMTFWHDDPEPGLEDMAELLRSHGVEAALSLESLRAEVERRYELGEDEETVYRHACGWLARAANATLAEADRDERWLAFRDPRCETDPLWLLLPPAAASGLVAAGVLEPPGALERLYSR